MKIWNEYIILAVVCTVDLESFPTRFVTVERLPDIDVVLSASDMKD
jgi:hypothetical protein